ncbi:hypothetical protein Leryth_003463 [Lithospermum erythrorhizon]|nr:hypothetical protein Leryth_003463 [Lithospermum erythrorhizon]
MLKRITINFTRTSNQKPCTNSLGETQHIKCPHHISLVKSQSRISTTKLVHIIITNQLSNKHHIP